MPKFVLKEMESLYIEELTGSISTLKSNLESLPVQQGKTKDSKFPPLKINKLNNMSAKLNLESIDSTENLDTANILDQRKQSLVSKKTSIGTFSYPRGSTKT